MQAKVRNSYARNTLEVSCKVANLFALPYTELSLLSYSLMILIMVYIKVTQFLSRGLAICFTLNQKQLELELGAAVGERPLLYMHQKA